MPGTERDVSEDCSAMPQDDATLARLPIVVVCGMTFEARIAAGNAVRVVCRQNATLADALDAVLAQGCAGVISFGTAGGLIDTLRPGAWVVARSVLAGTDCFETDVAWSQSLQRALPTARYADLAGVTSPVVEADEKRALHRATGAEAVDMESHIAARLARKYGVPFACCRVVIDPVERSLPQAAIVSLRDDGSTDAWAVIHSLMRRPRQLPALLRLAFDAHRARRALRHGRRAVDDDFGRRGA